MSLRNSRQRALTPILLVVAGAILIIGSAAWFVFSSGSLARTDSSSQAQGIPYPEVNRISVADAKAAFDIGSAIFIDTRGEPSFSQGHIPGAIPMTPDEVISHLGELDRSIWIITYCT
jgi:3-mercaptopyruvate sulfurtransferase SseA